MIVADVAIASCRASEVASPDMVPAAADRLAHAIRHSASA